MKKTLLFFCFCFSILVANGQVSPFHPDPSPPREIPGYRLVWSDEFNYTGKPADSNWSYERGFVRNNEHQWYQEDNANVRNGALEITGRRERFNNPNFVAGSTDWRTNRQFVDFTSAAIHSRGKRSFRFGRFEIRAKIPAVTGAWPAIWTLGDWGEWPTNGEIDIMEYYGDGILANAAWGSTTRWQAIWDAVKIPMSHFTSRDPDWANKYHLWTMDWNPEFVKIYLNGELLNTIETAKTLNADGSNPFTSRNHYVLLNLALGGTNGGDPNRPNYPITYFVDYFRIYQLDPSYNNCFRPLFPNRNLAPDPECNAINPDGIGSRGRNRNAMRVYCGTFSGEISGGVYTQRINWTPGKSYRVRAMVWPNGNDVVLGVNGLGEDSDVQHLVAGPLKSWQMVDYVFTAPETAGTGGGIFLSGASGTLIDNVEVYEVENSFIEVCRTQLHFNNTQFERHFRVTAHNAASNFIVTAPQGITLSQNTITPQEAAAGIKITATYNRSAVINGQNINIANMQFNRSIRVNAAPREITDNLMSGWDAFGRTGAETEPNRFGWIANGTVTWRTANANTDVRFNDYTTAGNYSLNGERWAGRILHLRWDGAGLAPENTYAFPVELQAGRTYTLSGLFGWQANGGDHAIYSIGINSRSDNQGDMFTVHHRTIHRNDRFRLFSMAQTFTVPADGTYFVTFLNTGAIMGAIANFQVREGIFLPEEMTITPGTLTFTQTNRTRTIALQGRFIRGDIRINLPAGITINRPIVTADEINSNSMVVLIAEFDGSRTFLNEPIEFIGEGGITRSLVVSGVEFATSVGTTSENAVNLNAYVNNNRLITSFNLDSPGRVEFNLFNVKGMAVQSFVADFHSGENRYETDLAVPPGQYILRITGNMGVIVRKIQVF